MSADRDEINETKQAIIRLLRERPRSFHPKNAGEVAMFELLTEEYIKRTEGGLYALTEKGKRV